jgi:hypothetical protein
MFKLLLLLFGFAGGAAAATSWLLSEPGTAEGAATPAAPGSVNARVDELRGRINIALEVGRDEAIRSEHRLKAELDAYRKGAAS